MTLESLNLFKDIIKYFQNYLITDLINIILQYYKPKLLDKSILQEFEHAFSNDPKFLSSNLNPEDLKLFLEDMDTKSFYELYYFEELESHKNCAQYKNLLIGKLSISKYFCLTVFYSVYDGFDDPRSFCLDIKTDLNDIEYIDNYIKYIINN